MVAERARSTGVAMSRSATRSAARTSSSSTAAASSSPPTARPLARAAQFEPELLVCDLCCRPPRVGGRRRSERARAPRQRRRPAGSAAVVAAARPRGRGLRGARRSGSATTSRRTASRTVVLGLSGGIDSALVALVAADAVGARARPAAWSCPPPTPATRPRRTPARSPRNLGADADRDPDRASR